MNRRSFLTLGLKKPQQSKAGFGRMQQRTTSLTSQQAASRFLQQATFGPTLTEINSIADSGVETWIDQQMATPRSQILQYMWDIIDPVYRVEDQPLLGLPPFRWAWWQTAMTGPDLLRQRVAMALSEILVVSTKTDFLEDLSIGIAHYYDTLMKHAFGNYRDLLFDVTVHPVMGYYLSHAGNRKADPATNRFPDENYAREVMQLFSIGLYELNLDGSRKLDNNGNPIPTYDNGDISEFAKIFTGMTHDSNNDWFEEEGIDPESEDAFVLSEPSWESITKPLKMWEKFHEPGEKKLLNGVVIPSSQDGMQDVNAAVDNLFNHANVGPFIGRLLIQRLVKSNPSPAYIARVATAFNNNGQGLRGDMQAVVKAILLDDEARNASYISDPTHGMLREPFVRYVQLCRAFEAKNEQGENQFYNFAEYAEAELGQYPFASPSVFNFFSPDFRPIGSLNQAGLDAPEFQIMTSVTAVKNMNFWEEAISDGALMEMPDGTVEADEQVPFVSEVVLDLAPYMAIEGDVDAVIDRIDLLLTYGTLSPAMRGIMRTALIGLADDGAEWNEVVNLAIYLFMNCPEYTILK